MAESFLHTCWNKNDEEAASYGSDTDAGEDQPDALE